MSSEERHTHTAEEVLLLIFSIDWDHKIIVKPVKFAFTKCRFSIHSEGEGWARREWADTDYLMLYPEVITAGTTRSTRGRRAEGRGIRVGEKREESASCECLVQLSAVAELQDVAGALSSINNAPMGVQRSRENERRG